MVDPPSLWMPCATFFKGSIPPRCRISFPDHTIYIGIPVLSQYVDQEALDIPLYWGNVLVGVVTCCRIHFSHEDTDYEGAALSFFFSLVVISIGIMLLVAGSKCKGQAQIYLTMKQTGVGKGEGRSVLA